ncbi:hypothetical protein [Burkholderia ubonensis]|uniref:hypothetical protein n=1 Tax=Burkholderia ubonensis TaxID=101571 RepID=UPI001E3BE93C|nr:hypothetical protein [Burkholderia ubonensis]
MKRLMRGQANSGRTAEQQQRFSECIRATGSAARRMAAGCFTGCRLLRCSGERRQCINTGFQALDLMLFARIRNTAEQVFRTRKLFARLVNV